MNGASDGAPNMAAKTNSPESHLDRPSNRCQSFRTDGSGRQSAPCSMFLSDPLPHVTTQHSGVGNSLGSAVEKSASVESVLPAKQFIEARCVEMKIVSIPRALS